MTFNDIFKSSFLESITEFSAVDTLIAMVAALVIGMFIFVVYKKTFNSVMYSTGFAMTLVGMTMVTTLVILAVTSNVVLSLGMVGALSIVRFRAAIKEPMEIVYLFWAVADRNCDRCGNAAAGSDRFCYYRCDSYSFCQQKNT